MSISESETVLCLNLSRGPGRSPARSGQRAGVPGASRTNSEQGRRGEVDAGRRRLSDSLSTRSDVAADVYLAQAGTDRIIGIGDFDVHEPSLRVLAVLKKCIVRLGRVWPTSRAPALVEQLQQPQRVNTLRHHALVHDETSDLSVAILRIAEFGITRGEIPMLASDACF